jgi:serine/threonine protein kinase
LAELQKLCILSARQLDELHPAIGDSAPDDRALARLLLDRDWLTPFQVNHLLQHHAERLVVGSYILTRRLGEGVLGDVYLAKHQRMRRAVTLTVVRKDLLAHPEAVERFYHEIQAVSRLSHPHIICAFDAGPVDGAHFFAMEWVDGVDLGRLVQQSGPLPIPMACTFLRQAALGLQHAWERRVLHHDLQPANLFVARLAGPADPGLSATHTPSTSSQFGGPTLKINNLGLSLLQPRSGDRSTLLAGSPDYLPPELAGGGEVVDVRSNLYSLGCVFYYLLTGKVVFPVDDSSTKLRQHRDAPPPNVSLLRHDVPAEVADLIQRLLAKCPADRPANPAALAEELRVLIGEDAAAPAAPLAPTEPSLFPATDAWPTEATSSAETTTRLPQSSTKPMVRPRPASPVPRRRRRRQLLLIVAISAVVLGLLALGARLLSPAPPSAEAADEGSNPAPEPAIPSTMLRTEPQYVKKETREETILATLRANGLPNLEGPWYYIGPFEGGPGDGFGRAYPPENDLDLNRIYIGKNNMEARWKKFPDYRPGKVQNLRLFGADDGAGVYIYLPIETATAVSLPVGFGSDDTLTVWLNRKLLISKNVSRSLQRDSEVVTLNLRPGVNHLLLKVCNGVGRWEFSVMPRWPAALEKSLGETLRRDFP